MGNPNSQLTRFVGVIAALVGVVGYALLGWRFGDGGSTLSTLLGAGVAVGVVGWTLFTRTERA